ncbi:MAG: hypothetical protein N2482_00315 [Patescibacteria group bacterium]|nr:hypothetical protein [Patescibacteria group bacterium]
MEIIYFLSSVNKISLVSFLIVLGFLIYEIYLFKKEKCKQNKPFIPKFEEEKKILVEQGQKIIFQKQKTLTKINQTYIWLILVILVVFFGMVTVYSGINQKQISQKNEEKKITDSQTLPLVSYVRSKGIKLFNEEKKLFSEEDLKKLKSGNKIIIGIETIEQADIDYARIKVNKKEWETSDITMKFDQTNKVFYIEYVIPEKTERLKIDAQLHSKTDGWLGD